MKDFDIWLDENKSQFDDDVYGLFHDSIQCYKNNINHPAYLLAYQGLMQYIRLIMLHSTNPPTGIAQIEWQNNYINVLQDEDHWDNKAFQCVQQGSQGAGTKILSIPKIAREKWEFWRQCRNVCAHYKAFELTQAHTVALYSFIEQYIFQIFIEGGQSSLLQEFDEYYDPSRTSPNTDISPLLLKIEKMVDECDFPAFIAEVRKSSRKYDKYSDDRFIDTIYVVFDKCSSSVRKAFQDYLQGDNDLQQSYLEKHPECILSVLPTKPTIVHEFWYKALPTYRSKLTILAILLESNQIQGQDIETSIDKCLSYMYQYNFPAYYTPIKQEYINILTSFGYFDVFYKNYFNSSYTLSHCQDLNYKMSFLSSNIDIIPKDKRYVKTMIEIVSQKYKPYALENMFQDRYRNNALYKAAIDTICSQEGLTLPSSIVGLIENA